MELPPHTMDLAPAVTRARPGPIQTGLGMFAGAALLAAGIIVPHPIPYIAGVLLFAVSIGAWTLGWLRGRADRSRTGADRAGRVRDRPRRGHPVSRALAVGIATAVILAIVPAGARWLASSSGVLWHTDTPPGAVIDSGDSIFLAGYPLDSNTSGLTAMNSRDGAITWDISGNEVYIAPEGVVISTSNRDHVTSYDADGQVQWEQDFAVADDQVLRIHAYRADTVLLSVCDEEATIVPCHLYGVDSDGDTAWEDERDVGSGLLELLADGRDEFGGPQLPTGAVLREDDELVAFDPRDGQTQQLRADDDSPAADPQGGSDVTVHHDQALVSSAGDAESALDGFDLPGGEHSWHASIDCDACQVPSAIPTYQYSLYAYFELTTLPERDSSVLVVDRRDGSAHTRTVEDFGDPDADDALWDRVITSVSVDLRFSWDGTTVSAADPLGDDSRWQLDAPGEEVRSVSGTADTVAITSRAAGHNPYLPPPQDCCSAEYVTVVDAASGTARSSTLFPEGATRAVVLASGQVAVHTEDGLSLVGAE